MHEIQQPPRPARTIYGCDFCKRTNVWKATMERHEKMCYYNPNRECEFCDGSGTIQLWTGGSSSDEPCHACKTAKEVQTERTTEEIT